MNMTSPERSEAAGGYALQIYERRFIGGEWVAPINGQVVESIAPPNGLPWARVAFGGPRDVDRAVAAARAACDGPSRRMPGWECAARLRKLAELYRDFSGDMAVLESRYSGRAIREARGDVGAHHQWYQWFTSLADKISGRTIPIVDSIHCFTNPVPVGVVGAITPWNAPMLTTAWRVSPALAAGCTVVLKLAEQTPVTALELDRLVEQAGFSPGVCNVVPGYWHDAGARLVAHPDVNKIAFTGEGRTAKTILRHGADNLKRFTFELGGKSPHIIFADADVDQALNAATSSAWAVYGQSWKDPYSCLKSSNILRSGARRPALAAARSASRRSTPAAS